MDPNVRDEIRLQPGNMKTKSVIRILLALSMHKIVRQGHEIKWKTKAGKFLIRNGSMFTHYTSPKLLICERINTVYLLITEFLLNQSKINML